MYVVNDQGRHRKVTKVCLFIYFNESLSSLGKCFEDIKYSYLIDRAYESGKVYDFFPLFLHPLLFLLDSI